MTELTKLIEEMEAAGEERVTGPWRVEDGELITAHEGGVSSYVLRTFPSAVGPTLGFIAFAGTHWQRILEALEQAQAENERLRENYAQLRKAAADLVIVQYQIANSIEGKAVVSLIKEDDLAY